MSGLAQMPVAWDGHPVTWSKWEPAPTICINVGLYDEVGEPLGTTDTCSHCHLHTERWTCRGTVTPSHFGLVTPLRRSTDLIATRCGRCGGTSVYDADTDQAWDLDDSDYGPTGSWVAS